MWAVYEASRSTVKYRVHYLKRGAKSDIIRDYIFKALNFRLKNSDIMLEAIRNHLKFVIK